MHLSKIISEAVCLNSFSQVWLITHQVWVGKTWWHHQGKKTQFIAPILFQFSPAQPFRRMLLKSMTLDLFILNITTSFTIHNNFYPFLMLTLELIIRSVLTYFIATRAIVLLAFVCMGRGVLHGNTTMEKLSALFLYKKTAWARSVWGRHGVLAQALNRSHHFTALSSELEKKPRNSRLTERSYQLLSIQSGQGQRRAPFKSLTFSSFDRTRHRMDED